MKKQVDDGSVVVEGSSDILSMALGTSERSGRVRGLGFGVTPSTYFEVRTMKESGRREKDN